MDQLADDLTADSRPAFNSVADRSALRAMLRKAKVHGVKGAHARYLAEAEAVEMHCRLPVPEVMDLPTTEYSWFAGYAWQSVHCPRC